MIDWHILQRLPKVTRVNFCGLYSWIDHTLLSILGAAEEVLVATFHGIAYSKVHLITFKYLWPMMASSISDLTRWKALPSAAFWKWEKIWRRLINLSCYQNQAIQHHLCDSALIWMWILGTVCQHVKQDKRRIMLNIKRLDHVSNARIHEVTNTQPLINTVRQRQLLFSWAHPQDARWWTMQEICSLSSNSWQKETRLTKDELHIVHPEAARGYRIWSAFRCLASFKSLSLEKFVVTCSSAEWW